MISMYTVGDWSPFDSYGLIACQTALELTGMGQQINAISLGDRQVVEQSDEVRAITARPIQASLGGIAMGWPNHYDKFSMLYWAGPKLAVTMFESSKVPAGWTEMLNRLDAVVTPSRFCLDLFRACGVTIPIYQVPLGINPAYSYVARPMRFSPARPLTFLAVMDRGERKGGELAMQAFLHAFGDDPTVRLVLKAREKKNRFTLTNANIETIFADYDEAQMVALYQRCDVLINPHKGEGFGLIPREFAATGGLALTTPWSGTADDLDQWGMPLPYRLERAGWAGNKGLEGQDLGYWAKLDIVEVAHTLRTVRAAYALHQRASKARSEFVHKSYSWRAFAAALLSIWEGLAQKPTDWKQLVFPELEIKAMPEMGVRA